jgi:integrase
MLSDMATHPTQPALMKHHGGRTWTSYWRDDSGKLRTKRFGKETDVTSKAARALYRNWIDREWQAKGFVQNPEGHSANYSCTRLAAKYLRYAHRTFRKHGRLTSHFTCVRYAMRNLRDFCGGDVAEAMDSPQLAALRDWMIEGRRKDPRDKTRTVTYLRSMKTVNDYLLIIKQAFEKAREWGHVPRNVVLDLQTVKPLIRGRSKARDSKEVRPIAADVVAATVPHCSSVVAAMIQVTMFTGARPGEICIMRPCDIEICSDDCWIYSPDEYKTELTDAGKGRRRRIALGPKAIQAVRPFLEAATSTRGYLFSPAASRAEQDRAKVVEREARRNPDAKPLYPSQVKRIQEKKRLEPQRAPRDHYSEESFRRAIHYACSKAGIDHWNPNQLRHTHGTAVRRVFGLVGIKDQGLTAARDALGHSNTRTTEGYAEESIERAMEIARRVG